MPNRATIRCFDSFYLKGKMLEQVLDFAFVAVRLFFRARFDQRMRINASDMFTNNQGDAENLLWNRLRCPAGVTGCCGVYKPRQPYPHFSTYPCTKRKNERHHHENQTHI